MFIQKIGDFDEWSRLLNGREQEDMSERQFSSYVDASELGNCGYKREIKVFFEADIT